MLIIRLQFLDRWTGAGTSNTIARVTRDDPNQNYTRMSDYYLQKGDYLRLKLVQIGYTLPKNISETIGASKVRFYVTGENIVTFTKYTGYDPEIAGEILLVLIELISTSQNFFVWR